MKKFLLLIFCAATVGFAGCDDEMPTSGHLIVTFSSSRVPEGVVLQTAEKQELYDWKVYKEQVKFELIPGNYCVIPYGFYGDHWCQVIAGKTTVLSFDSGGRSTSYIKK